MVLLMSLLEVLDMSDSSWCLWFAVVYQKLESIHSAIQELQGEYNIPDKDPSLSLIYTFVEELREPYLTEACVGCTRPFIPPHLLKSIDVLLPEYPERSSEDANRCTTCIAVGDLIQ